MYSVDRFERKLLVGAVYKFGRLYGIAAKESLKRYKSIFNYLLCKLNLS